MAGIGMGGVGGGHATRLPKRTSSGPERWPPQNCDLYLTLFSSADRTPAYKPLLTAASSSHSEAVFALCVEQIITGPWLGARSGEPFLGFHMTLWESAAVTKMIHARILPWLSYLCAFSNKVSVPKERAVMENV